jgi:uncharacterized protein (DUF1501 family)
MAQNARNNINILENKIVESTERGWEIIRNPSYSTINNLQDFSIQLKGNPMAVGKAASSFEQLYDQTANELLNKTGKESFEALKILKSNNIKNYQPANGAVYPSSALGNSLKQIATLIKMDIGLEVGFAESGGWDTHFNQGTTNGIFARNLKDFSDSIKIAEINANRYDIIRKKNNDY